MDCVGGVGVFRNRFRSPTIEQVFGQIKPREMSWNPGDSIRIQLIQSVQRKDLNTGQRVELVGGNFFACNDSIAGRVRISR